MSFAPVRQLAVWRTFSDGQRALVGGLAQNRQGVFFQYDADYLARFSPLSPFALTWDATVQLAPRDPHGGLPGVFADSLPDGWGLLLMDRVFRQQGILPAQVTPMDRLAFVGATGTGALSYTPVAEFAPVADDKLIETAELGLQAQAVFDGQTTDVLAELVAAGSSAGARPKAQLYFAEGEYGVCRTRPIAGDEAWLVKFTSANLPLGHEEGLCEAVYLSLAERAGLQPPRWQLLPAPEVLGARAWLAVERFDRVWRPEDVPGCVHLHSACGLLDADFRAPSLDYEDLIKASGQLCRGVNAAQLQFLRAVFNLFAVNQDDHSKNWAFLQSDDGHWQPAPFYDVTFSPGRFGEHSTAYAGFGKKPSLKAMQKLAAEAGFASWQQARQGIDRVLNALAGFSATAKALGVSTETTRLIQQQLDQAYQQNIK
ncbi:type II toxin-antitoxin system HipA family toxin [Marinobacter sp.]|uniref:type II toxin-antitoxin system HipA family toxin n=1 Tax=Marinobacter sp. TaxID=50741 RepID=UPI001A0BD949|nr:type II toxin-antitoxin system HipA family toxin [Marinobacter sp.]MBE0487142.1 type II toxin-antitoxin system HipA family toxin [Marinobacter sp.]